MTRLEAKGSIRIAVQTLDLSLYTSSPVYTRPHADQPEGQTQSLRSLVLRRVAESTNSIGSNDNVPNMMASLGAMA